MTQEPSRYWVLLQDGTVHEKALDLPALNEWIAQGTITKASKLCGEKERDWFDATQLSGLNFESDPAPAAEPEAAPEPVPAAEPEPAPEPAKAQEPEPEPEPAKAQEPEPEPEPVKAQEPVSSPSTATTPPAQSASTLPIPSIMGLAPEAVLVLIILASAMLIMMILGFIF